MGIRYSLQALVAGAVICSGLGSIAWAQEGGSTRTQTIVTVVPKGNETITMIPAQHVTAKVDGNKVPIENWQAFHETSPGTRTNLQLLLLIDDSARSTLGLHLPEMKAFLNKQAPTTQVAVAYMQNSGARLLQPFTTDHGAVAATLRLPMGIPGGNSPYFVLSDVVKHWPKPTAGVRREVVMVTDGIDRYYGLRFDPENPYVNSAMRDALRAGVVVYAIYFRDTGGVDRTYVGTNSGQNYLIELTEATGGKTFYVGFGDPVDMEPFFSEITNNLENQYQLSVTPPSGKKGLQQLKVMVNAPNTKVQAPDRIFIDDGK